MENGGVVPLMITLTTLLFVAGLVHAATRRLRAPYTIGLVAAGLALGLGAEALPLSSVFPRIRLTPDVIFSVIIPVLIFEAGIRIDPRHLRRELVPILTLAVPGMICSSLIIGALIGWISPLSFSVALLFGVLISGTDPVAIVTLLKESQASERLSVLLDGESLFIDAAAIVGFGLLSEAIIGAAGSLGTDSELGAVGRFLLTFFGGLAVGAAIGAASAELLRILYGDEAALITLSIVTAFSSFFVANHFLGVSGVLSVLAAAITFRSRGRSVVTAPSHRDAARFFWGYAAFLANTLVFLLLGLTQRQLFAHIGDYERPWLLLGGTVVAVLVGRIAAVQGMLPLATRLSRSEPVDARTRWVIVWGGLRGAVPLALVLLLPEDFPYRQGLFDMTLTVILFTLLVQGSTFGWVMARLGLTGAAPERTHTPGAPGDGW